MIALSIHCDTDCIGNDPLFAQTRKAPCRTAIESHPSSPVKRLTAVSMLFAISLFLCACTFDTSRLDQLTCQTSADCPGAASCLSGRCEPVPLPDNGAADVLDRDMDDPDAIGPDLQDTEDLVEDPDVSPSDASDPTEEDAPEDPPDLQDRPLDPVQDPTCDEPVNPCGGCLPLDANPGDPCEYQRCGVWQCDGPERLVCVEGPINVCGGCEELSASPGDPCGCGGEYECQGDQLVCAGSTGENPCGGCGGPEGEIGQPCLCESAVDEDHDWVCENDQLACRDQHDTMDEAMDLGETDDAMNAWGTLTGSLVDGETHDWFHIYVRDSVGADLNPSLALTNFAVSGRNHDLCAFWEYDDERDVEIWCDGGNPAVYNELPGCCSTNATTNDELIGLRNAVHYTNRLDTLGGGDNDNGTLWVHVTGEVGTGCDTYLLQYSF